MDASSINNPSRFAALARIGHYHQDDYLLNRRQALYRLIDMVAAIAHLVGKETYKQCNGSMLDFTRHGSYGRTCSIQKGK